MIFASLNIASVQNACVTTPYLLIIKGFFALIGEFSCYPFFRTDLPSHKCEGFFLESVCVIETL